MLLLKQLFRLQKFYRLLSNHELFIGWQAISTAHTLQLSSNKLLDKSSYDA
ncbi:hypothetical protein VCR20J5_1240131 [Vibrio crassostreae]|nr:hypothetical protein VCR20J5_1240131 [Vibrio crassostreae]